MNYASAQALIAQDTPVSRTSWDDCKIVRKAVESDIEFINYPVENITVEDCNRKYCDCKINIFYPSAEDIAAEDWVKVIRQPKA